MEPGVPSVFAVNVLAPYILTALIERPKRLVYLSSGMHRGVRHHREVVPEHPQQKAMPVIGVLSSDSPGPGCSECGRASPRTERDQLCRGTKFGDRMSGMLRTRQAATASPSL